MYNWIVFLLKNFLTIMNEQMVLLTHKREYVWKISCHMKSVSLSRFLLHRKEIFLRRIIPSALNTRLMMYVISFSKTAFSPFPSSPSLIQSSIFFFFQKLVLLFSFFVFYFLITLDAQPIYYIFSINIIFLEELTNHYWICDKSSERC